MPMLPIGLGAAGAAAGGAGGLGSILGAIVPLIGAIAGGGGGGQQSAPAPPPVAPAPAPPEVSTAADVAEEPIVDTEAARVRAQQRRTAAEDEETLTGLSDASKTAVNLTNSLLGE